MSDLLSSDPRPSDAHAVPTIQLLCSLCQDAQTGRGGAQRSKLDWKSHSLLLLDAVLGSGCSHFRGAFLWLGRTLADNLSLLKSHTSVWGETGSLTGINQVQLDMWWLWCSNHPQQESEYVGSFLWQQMQIGIIASHCIRAAKRSRLFSVSEKLNNESEVSEGNVLLLLDFLITSPCLLHVEFSFASNTYTRLSTSVYWRRWCTLWC